MLNSKFTARVRLISIKYGAITQTNFQNQLAYVWDALGRAVFIILIMFIFVQLWSAVYESQDTNAIAGLTLADTIWYFLIAEMIELGKFRHDQRISDEVKDGSIAYTLSRPYNYLFYHFFNGLGETVIKMALVFLLGLPIVLWSVGPPSITLQSLSPFLLVLFLALVLDFFMASSIGLLAFVTEDTFSFRLIYQKLIFILGGLLIPLDFLPPWLQQIARLLPFSQVNYAPAKLFVAFEWQLFLYTLALQLFWILVMGSLLTLQYRWATRRLVVNGG
ncbi:MAG: ABC transporter permease [Chloroflexi bacterium]|jgi:ABC-2 type transport system permease protein|nr:ABC transporter permease [Chloroflexota bacterium]